MRFHRWLYTIPLRLRSLFLRNHVEQELDEELRYHVEHLIQEYVSQGMKPREARNLALRAMGGVEQQKEQCRNMRRVNFIEHLFQDISFALRLLRKSPAFTVIAVVTLALGIGANTAIFSVVNAVLLRPLPFPNSDRLVQIWDTNPQAVRWGEWVAYPDFQDWRAQNKVFEEVGAYRELIFVMSGNRQPESFSGVYVSAGLISVMGAKPLLGRLFVDQDDLASTGRVVILSHRLWQRSFGGDPAVIGKEIILNGQNHTVVGVMPPDFKVPHSECDVWVAKGPPDEANDRNSYNCTVVARLKPGVTIEQAQANLDPIAAAIGEQFPQKRGMGVKVMSLQAVITKNARPSLLLLMAAIGLVLLIACVNVANLLLARSASRQRETAIRQAVGASRARLFRQLLTESLLLGLFGGVVGLLLAYLGVQSLIKLSPNIARLDQTSIDVRVLLVTLILSLLTGILFGTVPAILNSKTDLNEVLKSGGKTSSGRDGSRIRGALVVIETALAFILLVSAGLLIRSFVGIQQVDPGFDSNNVLIGGILLPETRYQESEQKVRFFKDVVERIKSVSGVQSAACTSSMPFFSNDAGGFWIEGRPPARPDEPTVDAERPKISPDYFRAMGIKLLRGREFTWADNERSPNVAIINEGMARDYWPGQDPIGKRVAINWEDSKEVWREVVGVIKDIKQDGLIEQARPMIYVPMAQYPEQFTILAVRTNGSTEAISAAIRREVAAIDKDQAVFAFKTMNRLVNDSISDKRAQMALLAIFAGIALMLAGVGIYGVLAYAVAQRTNEIGIRMALGAKTSDVLSMVIKQGMGLTFIGLLIGVAGGLALTRMLSSLLFQVKASDPATFSIVAFILAGVAFLACWWPARRAAKVDPMTALRYE